MKRKFVRTLKNILAEMGRNEMLKEGYALMK